MRIKNLRCPQRETKVETDEGIYGLGEAGLKRRGTAIAEVIRSFSPRRYRARPLSD